MTARSPIAARYARIAAGLTARIEAVPADRWGSPSPCEGWTALDVLRHVVDVHHMFPTNVGLALQPGPDPAADPLGAWASVRDQTIALLGDPARAGLEYDGGCWVGRVVLQRLATQTQASNTALFFQLELNGFAKVGSNPLDILRRNVPGYGVINQPGAENPLTTP